MVNLRFCVGSRAQEVRRLAGPSAVILEVACLEGGQRDTWRVDTEIPRSAWPSASSRWPTVPPAVSSCAAKSRWVGGLAPVVLGGDLDGRWSEHPTSLISWLDGESDITPSDPEMWARELGRALALVHSVPSDRLTDLPSVFDARGSQAELNGPLAAKVRSRWSQIIGSPEVLTHNDYWSGNVVWRGGRLTGIVDWSGPRAVDAASMSAGAASISFSCSTSELLTSFLRPMKPLPVRPSATWCSGTAGQSLARTS